MKQHIDNNPEIKILKLIRNISDELLEVEKENYRNLQSDINHFKKILTEKTLPQHEVNEVKEEISNLKKRLSSVKVDGDAYHEVSEIISSYLSYKNAEYYNCKEMNVVENFESVRGDIPTVKDVLQLHKKIPICAKVHIAHGIFKIIKKIYVESRGIDEKVLDEKIKAHQIDFDIEKIDLPVEYQINRDAIKWLFPNGFYNALPENWPYMKTPDKYQHILEWGFSKFLGSKEEYYSVKPGRPAKIKIGDTVLNKEKFNEHIFTEFRNEYPDSIDVGSFSAFNVHCKSSKV